MNRKDAEMLDQRVNKYLLEMAKEMNVEKSFAELIIGQYLEIIPENEKKDIVFLGTDSLSLKPGNIKLDIKNLLVACAELFASFNIPENSFNYIQLALLAFMFAAKVTMKSLNSDCAIIVYALDQLGAYELFVTEEQLKKEAESISSKAGKSSICDFEETINQLLKMKVIRMEDGKIALNEMVWGKI